MFIVHYQSQPDNAHLVKVGGLIVIVRGYSMMMMLTMTMMVMTLTEKKTKNYKMK